MGKSQKGIYSKCFGFFSTINFWRFIVALPMSSERYPYPVFFFFQVHFVVLDLSKLTFQVFVCWMFKIAIYKIFLLCVHLIFICKNGHKISCSRGSC